MMAYINAAETIQPSNILRTGGDMLPETTTESQVAAACLHWA